MYVCMKALFSSKKVNGKENQAVYHMLLKVLFSLYSFIIEIYILPPPHPNLSSWPSRTSFLLQIPDHLPGDGGGVELWDVT